MSLENIKFRVPADTMQALRDLRAEVSAWVDQAIFLADLVEKGEIVQQLGEGSYVSLSMRDIQPLPRPSENSFTAEEVTIGVDNSTYAHLFRPSHENLREWMSKAMALRLRAGELNLLHKTSEGYEPIKFPTG